MIYQILFILFINIVGFFLYPYYKWKYRLQTNKEVDRFIAWKSRQLEKGNDVSWKERQLQK